MKAYGLPRESYWKWYDIGDIKEYGLKSSTCNSKRKSGDYRSYFKNSEKKRNVRRYFKKVYRMKAKQVMRAGYDMCL